MYLQTHCILDTVCFLKSRKNLCFWYETTVHLICECKAEHPLASHPKVKDMLQKKVFYGIQFPKSCAIFFSPSSFWWCWWLGIWKQSTGKALTVLLNRLMLNSRQPTTKNLWSSNTVTLDVVFRKFTQMSATLECEPRQIFGAGSTGWRRIKTCLYLNFILDRFNLLINILISICLILYA